MLTGHNICCGYARTHKSTRVCVCVCVCGTQGHPLRLMYNMSSGFKSSWMGNGESERKNSKRACTVQQCVESEKEMTGREKEKTRFGGKKKRKYYPEHLSRPTHVLEVTLALYLT